MRLTAQDKWLLWAANCVSGSLDCSQKSINVRTWAAFFFFFKGAFIDQDIGNIYQVWCKICFGFFCFSFCRSFTVSPQGIFLVYDITSERSFQHIMKWASDVDEVSHKHWVFEINASYVHIVESTKNTFPSRHGWCKTECFSLTPPYCVHHVPSLSFCISDGCC